MRLVHASGCSRRPVNRLSRSLCDDPFLGRWTLPFRQIPWALPFAITQKEAKHAFQAWTSVASGQQVGHPASPKLSFRDVRPCHVPYYIFAGEQKITFTAVVGYDRSSDASDTAAKEFKCQGITCDSVQIGADNGPVAAVYAGFDFRRIYVRQALSADLSEDLLASAVPLPHVTDLPESAGVEAFKMKPSFAYKHRMTARLPSVAYSVAEAHVQADSMSSLVYEDSEGHAVCPDTEASKPAYYRVEEVEYALESARLHDRGVVMLPVWVVEYTFLGQPFRAFVSALKRREEPTVAGMVHRMPWAADDGDTWRAIGELRRSESTSNQDWKVERYWLDEVARVLQWQEQRQPGPGWRFSFGRQAGATAEEDASDYELLGLTASADLTEAAVAAAFRAQAMVWHPDLHHGLSPEELEECKQRFQRIMEAHSRLRRQHRQR